MHSCLTVKFFAAISRSWLFVQQVMISNLEPLIDKLFEEDELFAQDFEEDGLNRVLFIRKMGIYVEVSNQLSVDHF